MLLSKRSIMSLVIVVLSGVALWQLPNHVRGDNRLFGSNGTLLPALALAIICILSALDLIQAFFADRVRTVARQDTAPDVAFGKASLGGILLVTVLATLFAVSLRTVGYAPAAMLLVLALMFGTGGRDLRVNLLVSILAVGLLYVGIRFGLGVHIQVWPDFSRWTG